MSTGTIAGRYSLDAEIGRGGMGAVWRGTDTVLGRIVALKRVGVAPGGATADTVRAEREARLAARLNHPHVVAIFDLVEAGDEVGGDNWLVMEYVEGTNLAEIIRANGGLPPDQVAPLLAQTAGALAAAHAEGIVHRDVKPSNILVTPDGQVKLSDFGIARTEADAALTQTGLVTGSPAYLSPEVASGQLATPASDVWSLGATLYHALEGHPPYEIGDNLVGGLYRIVHEEPPRPSQPGWLAPLPAASMTRDPAARWSAAAVQAFLEGGPTAVPPPMPAVAAAAVTRVPDDGTVLLAPEPVDQRPLPQHPRRRAPAHRTGWWLVALLAVAVVVVTVVAFWIGFAHHGGTASNQGGSGSSQGPASGGSQTPSGAAPTADGMTSFLSDYLRTATSDPEAGFKLLTPGYQQQSHGLKGYESFWGSVSNAKLLSAQADPKTLVITYTYQYESRGKGSTRESHQMQLEFTHGTYLIKGQT